MSQCDDCDDVTCRDRYMPLPTTGCCRFKPHPPKPDPRDAEIARLTADLGAANERAEEYADMIYDLSPSGLVGHGADVAAAYEEAQADREQARADLAEAREQVRVAGDKIALVVGILDEPARDEPVKHTCPDIDAIQNVIKSTVRDCERAAKRTEDEAASDALTQAASDLGWDLPDKMEKLRRANDALRTWGANLAKAAADALAAAQGKEKEVTP